MEMQKGSSQVVVHQYSENMGFGDQFLEKDYEPNSSTPKLSLSIFPKKQKISESMANVMATPPSKISVSIPFQWEEAPGKPKSSSININSKTTITARRLGLPPRLVVVNNNLNSSDSSASSKFSAANFEVLDDPDHGKEYSVFSLEEEFVREAKYHHQERSLKSSSSWGLRSLKEEGSWPSLPSDQGFVGFPSSASSVSFPNSKSHNTKSSGSYKLLPRFKRSSSFASLSNASSNFMAGVYGSVKQVVVPWRRRQDQKQS